MPRRTAGRSAPRSKPESPPCRRSKSTPGCCVASNPLSGCGRPSSGSRRRAARCGSRPQRVRGDCPVEIGIYTFVERTRDPETGRVPSPEERMKNLLEEIELADQVGLDVFGIGEHHRPEYVASSPPVVMAAAAARTKNIRLTSAVTVLSSDDPDRKSTRLNS